MSRASLPLRLSMQGMVFSIFMTFHRRIPKDLTISTLSTQVVVQQSGSITFETSNVYTEATEMEGYLFF